MFIIKNVEIEEGASLAPMAGVSDRALRDLCISYGATFVVSEMVSAKALVMGDKKTPLLMENSESTHPYGIQVFGDNPDTMAKACEIIEKFNPDFIDINAGCPAPKITNNKGGSSLLKTPDLIYKIINKMKNSTDKPITIKIRKGFDDNSVNAVEVATIAEQAGASMITIHGRTRTQMYSPPVDYEIIKKVKESVNIPVIANGDIETLDDYIKIKKFTKADGIAIGRGALGNPFIFKQIRHYIKTKEILPELTLNEKIEIMKNHIELLCQYKGEYVGMKEARKHCSFYMKGINGAAKFRKQCSYLETIEDFHSLIKTIKDFNSFSL